LLDSKFPESRDIGDRLYLLGYHPSYEKKVDP
jgi:hypothetical protein